MPSLITHTAVPIALACAAGTRTVPPRLLAAAVAASVIPDADVLGFSFGIHYADVLGHRGFFHSPFFAFPASLLAALAWRRLGTGFWTVFGILFLSLASHGVLDAATSGGLGIAFLSPFSNQRYFFPWHPIVVSPFGVREFFGPWGLRVIRSELLWVWTPCLALSLAAVGMRSYYLRRRASDGQVSTL